MRLPGISDKEAGPLVRLAYWFTRRKIGKVPGPIRLHAYHTRLLRALASMEMGQEAARRVDPALKSLVSIKAATLVGCPF